MKRGMGRKGVTVGLVLAGMIAATPAWANYFCVGQVDAVAVSPTGVVMIDAASVGLSWQYLCQIGATTNTVGPDTCKAILAVLIAAQETGQQVQWAFNDGLSCTTHPAWSWLTGWYWGPVLV